MKHFICGNELFRVSYSRGASLCGAILRSFRKARRLRSGTGILPVRIKRYWRIIETHGRDARATSFFAALQRCLIALFATASISAIPAMGQWVSVDPSYPAGSGPSDAVRCLAIQPDGKALVGGNFTSVNGVPASHLVRMNTNGTVDASFSSQLDSAPYFIEILPSGQILVNGYFSKVDGVSRPGLARLNEDGSLDTAFVPPALSSGFSGAAAAPDGKVIVTGIFTTLGGLPRTNVARLVDDGSVDPAFQPPFQSPDIVSLLAVQPDRKPIFSGSFTNVAGVNVTNLVRLNLDGSVDESFQPDLAPDERVSRAVLQPDGKLIVGIRPVSVYPFVAAPSQLFRLGTNGTRDAEFSEIVGFGGSAGSWQSYPLYGLALQSDGKILVSGSFLSVNGVARAKIARLEPNGSLDYCFDLAFGTEIFPLAVAPESGGAILVGGSFSGVNGRYHPNLVRLVPPSQCNPGEISMAGPALFVRDDESRVVVPVVRHGGADMDQTVQFTTLGGSAYDGVDFDGVSGIVHFAPGERSQFISVALLHQNTNADSRTFDVVLYQPGGGAVLGPLTTTTVTLTSAPRGSAGAPDTNYVVQLDGSVNSILPRPDGSALIIGSFTNVNGDVCPNLALLRPDGSRDTAFARTQPFDGAIQAATFDWQGRLLVAGDFRHVDGVWRPGLARLESSGALDSSFAPFDSWPTNNYYAVEMSAVAVLADGNIVCGGLVPDTNYSGSHVLLKLSPTGELDEAFTNIPPDTRTYALKPLREGDFLFAGSGLGNSLMRLHEDGTTDFGFAPPVDQQFGGTRVRLTSCPEDALSSRATQMFCLVWLVKRRFRN